MKSTKDESASCSEQWFTYQKHDNSIKGHETIQNVDAVYIISCDSFPGYLLF